MLTWILRATDWLISDMPFLIEGRIYCVLNRRRFEPLYKALQGIGPLIPKSPLIEWEEDEDGVRTPKNWSMEDVRDEDVAELVLDIPEYGRLLTMARNEELLWQMVEKYRRLKEA